MLIYKSLPTDNEEIVNMLDFSGHCIQNCILELFAINKKSHSVLNPIYHYKDLAYKYTKAESKSYEDNKLALSPFTLSDSIKVNAYADS